MKEQTTISDSKAIFHKEFDYVIPHVYRKVADELLVELHLLSHQKKFKYDGLFAIGLRKAFNEFTKGYKPDSHREKLLKAICESSYFDYEKVLTDSKHLEKLIQEESIENIKLLLIDRKISNKNIEVLSKIITENQHYTRLCTVGLFELLKIKDIDLNDEKELLKNISSGLGYNESRVQKDLNNYLNNLQKISKALELIEININEEKKRELKRKS